MKLCSSQHFTPLSKTEHFFFFGLHVNELSTLRFVPPQALIFNRLLRQMSLVSFSNFGLTYIMFDTFYVLLLYIFQIDFFETF